MAGRLTFGKSHKLCSRTAIETLFAARHEGCSALSYPLRAVWTSIERPQTQRAEILISVPKRKLRHAVDRVAIRRRIREAYRLNHADIIPSVGAPLQVAFIYVADRIEPYARIERAMLRLLTSIAR